MSKVADAFRWPSMLIESTETVSQNFDFWACLSHNVEKRDAGSKKGKLLCCKHIFDRIKANLVKIQLKKHQNVQKTHFLQKVPGVNGLTDTGHVK